MSLGYTFYPQDWWTSQTFFSLPPEMRYIFLEILNLLYMNDGYYKVNRIEIYKRFGVEVGDSGWEILKEQFIIEEEIWTHSSVNKRLKKAKTNRENGQLGGRPPKPKKPRKKTQKNPPLERESKDEIKEKVKGKVKGNYNIPTLAEVIDYFCQAGYTEEAAKKAYWYYEETRRDEGAKTWVDSKGNTVKSWKQKMRGVWFKEENKIKSNTNRLTF